MSLLFDLETDGLLKELTKIHCCVIIDTDTNKTTAYGPEQIPAALERLAAADELVGHNILGFDIPAIKKLYPDWQHQGTLKDTLVMSRLVFADLMTIDSARNFLGLPGRLHGSHSLRAWGIRLAKLKDEYDGGWETFNDEMLSYCVQDTKVTLTLLEKIKAQNFSAKSIELEHTLAAICIEIGNAGWTFDIAKASDLYATLAQKRAVLEAELQTLFEPWEIREIFIPKVTNAARGYVKGEASTKVKTVEFNPNSRQHIARCLHKKYGWEPEEFTPSGQPKIDESVLLKLDFEESKKLAEMFLLQKRIAMLAEGKNAWLRLVDADGRLRHTIISGGTISGRAAARSPNLQQVPGQQSPYGIECRELFTVPDGWVLCGADLSGLELRALAHFIASYPEDGGKYATQIMESDIHAYNQKAAGLETRTQAKTFIYSLLFNAGDRLIGEIVGGKPAAGKKLKEAFDAAVPAFPHLKKDLLEIYKTRGYLHGLDGRKLYIRGQSVLLSQLLQSAGAILCKKWVQLTYEEIIKQDLTDQVQIIAWVHDEMQIACKNEEIANHVGEIAKTMAGKAGEAFETLIPIQAEFKVGKTWADTH